jgi:hypothetical protein
MRSLRWHGGSAGALVGPERAARGAACGHKGATRQHPGWVDAAVGFQSFPTGRA